MISILLNSWRSILYIECQRHVRFVFFGKKLNVNELRTFLWDLGFFICILIDTRIFLVGYLQKKSTVEKRPSRFIIAHLMSSGLDIAARFLVILKVTNVNKWVSFPQAVILLLSCAESVQMYHSSNRGRIAEVMVTFLQFKIFTSNLKMFN